MMKSPYVPAIIQSVGLACVPIDHMPPDTPLDRKPVAAAIVTIHEREDGHRDVTIRCVSDARDQEFPLPVLVDDALVGGVPVIIIGTDRDILTMDATSRRFFSEPKLATLAKGQGLLDPVAMLGSGIDEVALCRRLGITVDRVADNDVAKCWSRSAPMAAEGVALTNAVARLMLWAHAASFLDVVPDAFFEVLLPLRERLMDLEAERPALKAIMNSRPFRRATSFATYYREYRARRNGGDEDARWVTFEEGLTYV